MIDGDDVLTVSDDEQLQQSPDANGNGGAARSKLVVEEEVDLTAPTSSEAPKLTSLAELATTNGSSENGRLTITITGFEKRGDGINAYLVYKVVTKAENVIGYSNDHYDVWRRFSDFLGLHEKLVEKFQHEGIPIPYAPEKSIAALTKTKLNGSDDSLSNEIADRRTRALQRFVRRVAKHPRLASDCDFRDFLTMNVELPKANNTSALSGASVKKLFKSFGETFSKITTHMDESDTWFEQAQTETEEFEELMTRMLAIVDGLVQQRRELSVNHDALSKSMSLLASCEENTSLARALSHLTETHENIALLQRIQTDKDTMILSETLHEHMTMIAALKDVLNERVKIWHKWQQAQQNLTKKREMKARFELSGRNDRAAQVREELTACERNVDDAEKEFKDVSAVIRVEYERFHKIRKQELCDMMIAFMESLAETEEKVLKHWEKFAPESRNVITS